MLLTQACVEPGPRRNPLRPETLHSFPPVTRRPEWVNERPAPK